MEFWAHYFNEAKWLTDYSYSLVLAVLVFSFLEVVVPVIPGYTVLVVGSSLAATTGLAPFWLIIGSSVGTWLASLLCYNLGNRLGICLLEQPRFARLLDSQSFAKIKRWFGRYGDVVLLVSRLLPLARSGIILSAGIVKYEKRRAMAVLAVSILFTATIYVAIGYWMGTRWRELARWWQPGYNLILLLMAVGIAGTWGVRKWRRDHDGCVLERKKIEYTEPKCNSSRNDHER
jgi:membrane protein DedA with SNARE-associated domain